MKLLLAVTSVTLMALSAGCWADLTTPQPGPTLPDTIPTGEVIPCTPADTVGGLVSCY